MGVLLMETLVHLLLERGLHEVDRLGLVLCWVASLMGLGLLSHGQGQPNQLGDQFEYLEGQQYLCQLLWHYQEFHQRVLCDFYFLQEGVDLRLTLTQ
jgi:hypothetical protein